MLWVWSPQQAGVTTGECEKRKHCVRTKHVSMDGVNSEPWNIGTQRPWASVLRRGYKTHLAPNLLQQALQARRLALRLVCCRFCHLHDESPPAVRKSAALEQSQCPSCQRCDAAAKGDRVQRRQPISRDYTAPQPNG